MVVTAVRQYASRAAFWHLPSASKSDRVLTRSAACLAIFGIALSSFSLGQMLDNNSNGNANKAPTIPIRKFH